MKYLKPYKIFESNDSKFSNKMIEVIKDICLELNDNNIETDIRIVEYYPPLITGVIESISVDLCSDIPYRYDDFKDVLDRLEEYCFRKGTGYSIDIEVISDNDYMSIDRFVDIYSGDEFGNGYGGNISFLIYSQDDYNSISEGYINESRVDDKIQLLKDLSLDLQDKGLQVNIINGKDGHLLRDPRVAVQTNSRYSSDFKDYIIMIVTDDDNLLNTDLYYTDTIQDFIEDLKSYGMNPRSMNGGRNFAVFKFDKWGKMTSSYFESNPIIESKWGAVRDVQDIQHHYSIYDWFENLKSIQWNRKSINNSDLKKWSDHFIGSGVYQKISNLVDNIFESIRSVDYNYINDRMLEVWDELPISKDKYVMACVAYGGYENLDREIMYRYSGLLSVMNPFDDSKKLDIIIHIIKEILYPTLFIGSPSISLRKTEEQIYVTDKKWNCVNFDIDSYEFNEGEEFVDVGFLKTPGETGRRSTTTIFKSDLYKKKNYGVDKVISMYKPCLVIEIGGHNDSYRTGKISLSKLEPLLDDVLETILPDLDYEEVIWDKARGSRQFSDDEFYDYTLKILLK
jgi:hypothetical protein